MPTIAIIPASETIATEQDLQLDIFVEGPAWEGQFDALEVWRSRLGPQGPFEALTGDIWKSARLPLVTGDAPTVPETGPNATISGKNLALRINEEIDLLVVFTGSNPLTFGDAATQITAQGLRLIRAFVRGNSLIIETAQPGSGATLRVVGGDAAPLLGLPTLEPSSVAFGQDARLPLIQGQTRYLYTDHNGSPEFFYKTRFYNTTLRATSLFSLPFSGKNISAIATENLVRATVDLVDAHGVALAHRTVLLAPSFRGGRVEGKTVVGGKLSKLTDERGHAEFMLVRGQPFAVAIAGTDLVRDFTSPTDPTVLSFDVLDPAYGQNDLFSVQQPALDFATRRSL